MLDVPGESRERLAMAKGYLIITLNGASSLNSLGEYHRNAEHNALIWRDRIFDPDNATDIEDFNKWIISLQEDWRFAYPDDPRVPTARVVHKRYPNLEKARAALTPPAKKAPAKKKAKAKKAPAKKAVAKKVVKKKATNGRARSTQRST